MSEERTGTAITEITPYAIPLEYGGPNGKIALASYSIKDAIAAVSSNNRARGFTLCKIFKAKVTDDETQEEDVYESRKDGLTYYFAMKILDPEELRTSEAYEEFRRVFGKTLDPDDPFTKMEGPYVFYLTPSGKAASPLKHRDCKDTVLINLDGKTIWSPPKP